MKIIILAASMFISGLGAGNAIWGDGKMMNTCTLCIIILSIVQIMIPRRTSKN